MNEQTFGQVDPSDAAFQQEYQYMMQDRVVNNYLTLESPFNIAQPSGYPAVATSTTSDAVYTPQFAAHPGVSGTQELAGSAYGTNDDANLWQATTPVAFAGTASSISTMGALANNLGNINFYPHSQSDAGASSRQQRHSQRPRQHNRALQPATTSSGTGLVTRTDLYRTRVPSEQGDNLLAEHAIDVHGGYQCRNCTVVKPARCDMVKHIKTHLKLYSCDYPNCSKSFATKSDLTRHELKHKDKDSLPYYYVCTIGACSDKYKHWRRWDNFKVHLKGQHHVEKPQQQDYFRYQNPVQNQNQELLGLGGTFANDTPMDMGPGNDEVVALNLPSPPAIDGSYHFNDLDQLLGQVSSSDAPLAQTGNVNTQQQLVACTSPALQYFTAANSQQLATGNQFGYDQSFSDSASASASGSWNLPSSNPTKSMHLSASLHASTAFTTPRSSSSMPPPSLPQVSRPTRARGNGSLAQPAATRSPHSLSFTEHSLPSHVQSPQSPPARQKRVSFGILCENEQGTAMENVDFSMAACSVNSPGLAGASSGGASNGNDDDDDDGSHNSDSDDDSDPGNNRDDVLSVNTVGDSTVNTVGDSIGETEAMPLFNGGEPQPGALDEKTNDADCPASDSSQELLTGTTTSTDLPPEIHIDDDTEIDLESPSTPSGQPLQRHDMEPRLAVDEVLKQLPELPPEDLKLLLEKMKETGALDKAGYELVTLAQASTTTRSVKSVPASEMGDDKVYRCEAEGCSASFATSSSLKKHETRHKRPFACTHGCMVGDYPSARAFGSKNDWKRHEEALHFQAATPNMTWECEEADNKTPCGKLFTTSAGLTNHLVDAHNAISKDKKTAEKVAKGRRIPAADYLFWCGFCHKRLGPAVNAPPASSTATIPYSRWLNARFNHIDDHFTGRQFQAANIADWKSEEQIREQELAAAEQAKAGPSSQLTETHKRSLDQSSNSDPSKKRRGEVIAYNWICCHCNNVGSTRFDGSCGSCQRLRCNNCEIYTVLADESC